jgi:hypothetical protein
VVKHSTNEKNQEGKVMTAKVARNKQEKKESASSQEK